MQPAAGGRRGYDFGRQLGGLGNSQDSAADQTYRVHHNTELCYVFNPRPTPRGPESDEVLLHG